MVSSPFVDSNLARYDADVRIVLDRPAIWSTGEIQHSLLRSISFLFQFRRLTPSLDSCLIR